MVDSDALATLAHDLAEIFTGRLRSIVRYGTITMAPGSPRTTLAVVDRLTADDLRACATRVQKWHRGGLATPLLVSAGEFRRSLDAFPFEFGAILGDYTVLQGDDPFQGLRVEPSDLRRACEVQARGHLLHLREAFIETQGQNVAVASLIARSAAPLAALLRNISRLNRAFPVDGALTRVAQLENGGTLPETQAPELFRTYLDAMERLTNSIDQWSST